jgi:glycosyltransferase involved in cell wall biosynthesis
MSTILDPHELKELVFQSTESGNFEKALFLITDFVANVVQDSCATANVLSSKELDDLCRYIGKKSFEENPKIIQNISEVKEDIVIYVATELYNTGGHTAVIEDFITYQPNKTHIILVTDIFEQFNISDVQDRFSYPNVNLEKAPHGGFYTKMQWLQQKLFQYSPSKIFLFNHHQDAVIIAATCLNFKSQVIFYHHGDHHLCLGVSLNDVIHIDPHPQGFYSCRNHLGIKNNVYLPLSAKDFGYALGERKFVVNNIKTCSSGGQPKFEQEYKYQYSKIIPKVLQITKGFHVHIGPLSEKSLTEIRNGMQNYDIPPKNFIHIPWVKSIWLTLQKEEVDLYLESFPVGGAKTAIEVMGSGTPIVSHQNYKSRLLCCFDINYPEALFWKKPDELYEIISEVTPEFLQKQSICARRHYEQFHSPDVIAQQFLAICYKKKAYEPMPLKDYQLDPLQVFIDFRKIHDDTILQLKLDVEKSFFWKLRNQWFLLKQILGLVKTS